MVTRYYGCPRRGVQHGFPARPPAGAPGA